MRPSETIQLGSVQCSAVNVGHGCDGCQGLPATAVSEAQAAKRGTAILLCLHLPRRQPSIGRRLWLAAGASQSAAFRDMPKFNVVQSDTSSRCSYAMQMQLACGCLTGAASWIGSRVETEASAGIPAPGLGHRRGLVHRPPRTLTWAQSLTWASGRWAHWKKTWLDLATSAGCQPACSCKASAD